MTKTFAERCQLAQQLLPDAQYRAMLTALHDEMLAKLAEQPAQQEPYGWHTEDHLTDRSATTYSKDVADCWKSKGWPVTPFYTTPQAQPAPEIAIADAYRAGVDSGIAAEREACAKVCDDWPNGREDVYSIDVAIRARGKT